MIFNSLLCSYPSILTRTSLPDPDHILEKIYINPDPDPTLMFKIDPDPYENDVELSIVQLPKYLDAEAPSPRVDKNITKPGVSKFVYCYHGTYIRW